jgi:hypothetical protein
LTLMAERRLRAAFSFIGKIHDPDACIDKDYH